MQTEAFQIFKTVNKQCHFVTDPYITIEHLRDHDKYVSDMKLACASREKYIRRVVLTQEIDKAKANRKELAKTIYRTEKERTTEQNRKELVMMIYKYKYNLV